MLLTRPRETNVLPGLEADQDQRNDFKSAKYSPETEYDVWGYREMEMVKCPYNPAREKYHG